MRFERFETSAFTLLRQDGHARYFLRGLLGKLGGSDGQ